MTKVEFRGRLSNTEARAVSKLISKRGSNLRFSSLAIVGGAFCLALAAIQAFSGNSEAAFSWLAYGIVVPALGIGLRWFESRASRRFIREHTHQGLIVEDGIRLVEADAETLLRWSAFTSIDKHGDLLLLWLTNGAYLPLAPTLFANDAAYRRGCAVVVDAITQIPSPKR